MSFKSLALLGLLSTVLPLSADDPCCPPPDPCAKCAQIWPTRGPDWIITPGAGPCVNDGWDAHISVDFIYWSTREDQLGFVQREFIETLPDGQIAATSKAETYHPSWHFEPGFKIGVGILKNHDGWDLNLLYTRLRVCDTKKSVHINDLTSQRLTIISGASADPGIQNITRASAFWELDFDVIDAELGRNFFISRYLVLRPFVSMKGTVQDQTYRVKTEGEAPQFGVSNDAAQGVSFGQLHYWGVGVRGGINTSWHFNRCWSLHGNFAATALWESFESHLKATRSLTTPQTGSSPVTTLYVENDFTTVKPVVEFQLGLRYETWFCCENYHLSLQGGWETQWWGDQNQFYTLERESRLGDLVLTGLTIQLRLDF